MVCASLRGLLRLPIECTSLIFPAVLWVVGLGAGILWWAVFLFRAGLGYLPVGFFRAILISPSTLFVLFFLSSHEQASPGEPSGS